MSGLENKLRAALRETAGEIPDDPPPLRLTQLAVSGHSARQHGPKQHWFQQHRARWPAWAAPLAAAAAIVALILASLTLVHDRPNVEGPSTGQATTTPPGLAGVPPYYVALTVPGTHPDPSDGGATVAEVRATATGAVLARINVPKPYAFFSGLSAAADDRTFVLVAEEKSNPPKKPQVYYPPSRFFVLHIEPADSGRSVQVSLRALPAVYIPANDEVHDLALSPDGHALAADIGPVAGSQLFVFDLTTGNQRAWSFVKTCRHCSPSSGGLDFGGTNPDALSWTADGRHLAFIGPGATSHSYRAVRLLDVRADGGDLLASSKPVFPWPGGTTQALVGEEWRGAVITPDGQTVVFLEQLVSNQPNSVREVLGKGSTVTGKQTFVYRNLKPVGQYQQVMYTNATGSALVVAYFGLGYGWHAGILRGDQFTPIPWSPHIMTAAW